MELLTLFYVFFRIGLFGFGGGYAMLPFIYESVQSFGFMDTEEFSNLLAVSQITPGPIALNAATYVGYSSSGILGGAVASFAVILPSLIIICIIVHFYNKYLESRIVEGIFTGIRPVTVGLLASAIVFIGESSLFKAELSISNILEYGYRYINIIPLCIFLAVILLNGKFKLNPIIIMILSGLVGAFFL